MNTDLALGGIIISAIVAVILWFVITVLFGFNVGSGFFWIVFIIASIFFLAASIYEHKEIKKLEEKSKIASQKEKERKIRRETEIKEKYGVSGLDIKNPYISVVDRYYIRVFFTKKIILIDNKEFDFSEIVSCNIVERSDSGMTMKSVQTPTPNNVGIAGRAIVGGLIAGPAGAIIGGLTAPNKTKTDIQYVHTSYTAYNVNIFTKNEKHPIITLDVKADISLANEIKSAIDGVISYNS